LYANIEEASSQESVLTIEGPGVGTQAGLHIRNTVVHLISCPEISNSKN